MTGTEGQTPVEQIIDATRQWPEVTLGPHRYEGVEFLLDDYEFGHVHHGWRSLHINYPRRLRDTLIEEGRTAKHPYFSNSGWTSYQLGSAGSVDDALWLLRVSYLYRSLTRRRTPVGQAVIASVDIPAELDALGVSEQVRTVFEPVMGLDSTARPEV